LSSTHTVVPYQCFKRPLILNLKKKKQNNGLLKAVILASGTGTRCADHHHWFHYVLG